MSANTVCLRGRHPDGACITHLCIHCKNFQPTIVYATVENVLRLREITDEATLVCRRALELNNNDITRAAEFLHNRGFAVIPKCSHFAYHE